MKKLVKRNVSAENQGGYAAFAACSLFLMVGALAGCFSGSYTQILTASTVLSGGNSTGFFEYLLKNVLVLLSVLLLGSSCIGFVFVPVLTLIAGFLSGFVLTAHS